MSTRVAVTFEPADVTVWVAPGSTVLEASKSAGVVLAAPCGGRGVCGSCGVRVVQGALASPDDIESAGIRRAQLGVRLACRARVVGTVTVRPLIVDSAAPQTKSHTERQHMTLVAGVDLGTTSIAAALIDPATGREVARSSVANPQRSHGADVLTRLGAAGDGEAHTLRLLAEKGVLAALEAAADGASVSLRGVERLVIAGNTSMGALLTGADTTDLAVYPFELPEVAASVPIDSGIREQLSNEVEIAVLPAIAGFVGGDTLAAIVAAGMVDACRPILLVDFGTNAEIVLAGAGSLVVASAAAGPAFEGGGLSCGGPAADGAVTSVRVEADGAVALRTLGDAPASWFSGSGFVSAVAELRRHGHIDSTGLLLADGPLAGRFGRDSSGVLFVRLGEDGDGCLVLTQLDIRALQLAKAAVRVGIEAVMRRGGVVASDLEAVLIAGALGAALQPQDLIELGVLPAGVERIARRVGNAALEGSAVVALAPELADVAVSSAHEARHVELATEPGFGRALVAATEFEPYTV